MAKDTYYFSHDSNARNDPKILAMRSVYGIEGYGMYWVIIEMLREQEEYKLTKGKYIFNAIAMQMQSKNVDAEYAKQFALDCINEFGLLHENEHFIWSNSLLKRMEIKDDISKKRSKAAQKRWGKVSNTNDSENEDANAMQVDSKSNAIKEKEKKVKEIKEKDNICANAFETFWTLYPKKTDKKKAFEKFKVAFKTHGADKIIEGAKNYAAECQIKGTDKQYIKHATTFLNAESFLNDFDLTAKEDKPYGSNNGNSKYADKAGRQYSIEPPPIDFEQR